MMNILRLSLIGLRERSAYLRNRATPKSASSGSRTTLTGCKEGKAARSKLQADFRGKQNQLKNREVALKRRYEQLEKQKNSGAPEQKLREDLAASKRASSKLSNCAPSSSKTSLRKRLT